VIDATLTSTTEAQGIRVATSRHSDRGFANAALDVAYRDNFHCGIMADAPL
jgi:hypothetical protein